jgi:hypothetical protein
LPGFISATMIPKRSVAKVFVTLVMLFFPLVGKSQFNKDSAIRPDPQRAVRFAVFPGGGQLHNRDYWKLPLVYLSLGGGIYAWHLNTLKYRDFLSAYISFYDQETGLLAPGVTSETRRPVKVRNLFNTSSRIDSALKDPIERQKNYWRRNRELALILTGAVYTLTIIEAYVASHLKTFDMSDDLTFRLEPQISQPLIPQPVPGVRLVFNFK